MLTAHQQYLFRELGLEEGTEREVRAVHKELIAKYGEVKDFTRYLVKRLHRQWARERSQNTTPYLGD